MNGEHFSSCLLIPGVAKRSSTGRSRPAILEHTVLTDDFIQQMISRNDRSMVGFENARLQDARCERYDSRICLTWLGVSMGRALYVGQQAW